MVLVLLGDSTSTKYLVEPSSLSCTTTYSYVLTCTDYAGNSGSSTVSMATDACPASVPGTSTTTTWTQTYADDSTELTSEGVTRQLSAKHRIRVKIGTTKHHVGVKSLTATSATIEIASDPVSVTLNVGQDAKVDLDEDGTYDLYVKLNSIADNKADVSVKKISEPVPEGEGAVSTTGEIEAEDGTPTGDDGAGEKDSTTWIWVIIIILVLVAVGAGVAVKKRK